MTRAAGVATVDCYWCDGRGWFRLGDTTVTPPTISRSPCDVCAGTGKVVDDRDEFKPEGDDDDDCF